MTGGSAFTGSCAAGFAAGALSDPAEVVVPAVLPAGRAAVRSANSTVTVVPARTATFFVTLTVSPSRSYSALNR